MTSSKIIVSIEQVRTALNQALDEITSAYGSEVAIEDSMYWTIDLPEVFTPSSPPQDLTLGSLGDDVSDVQRVLDTEDGYLGFPGLLHLGGILNGLAWSILYGEKVNQEPENPS